MLGMISCDESFFISLPLFLARKYNIFDYGFLYHDKQDDGPTEACEEEDKNTTTHTTTHIVFMWQQK